MVNKAIFVCLAIIPLHRGMSAVNIRQNIEHQEMREGSQQLPLGSPAIQPHVELWSFYRQPDKKPLDLSLFRQMLMPPQ